MKENDIQAFPLRVTTEKNGVVYKGYRPGMTLRDYFAGKAMQGFASSKEQWMSLCKDQRNLGKGMTVKEYASREAYKLADAMLKARKL